MSVCVCACMPACISVHSCSAGSHLVSVLIATRVLETTGKLDNNFTKQRPVLCMCVCMCVGMMDDCQRHFYVYICTCL